VLEVARRPGLWWRCGVPGPGTADASRTFADTYQALNQGAHGAHTGDPGQLIHGTRALVGKIRASLP
jgi:hypothetical protein